MRWYSISPQRMKIDRFLLNDINMYSKEDFLIDQKVIS